MGNSKQQSVSPSPDLSICEREQIHLASSVEPNGIILVAGEQSSSLVQLSANTYSILGEAPESLLGRPLRNLFSEQDLGRITSGGNKDGKRCYINDVRLSGTETIFDAIVHRQPGLLIIELEPASPASRSDAAAPFAALTDALDEMVGHLSLSTLCQKIASRIRLVTGFDRVMIYRFLKDDSGSVIAEDKREDLTPYLGLRYPASDIPAQARRFYLINGLRLKADVNAPAVALLPALNPLTGAPLDMTFCVLRAMSPVHVEYLRNMGVAASMSISIVKDGRLWGLVACHHTVARLVPHTIRVTCEILARAFSSHIAAAEESDERVRSASLMKLLDHVSFRLRRDFEVVGVLSEMAEEIAHLMGAFGSAMNVGGTLVLSGTTPCRERTETLIEWLKLSSQEPIFVTERLGDVYPAAHQFGEPIFGLLSIRVAFGGSDFLVWFRPPTEQVVNWGGNPEKPVEATSDGQRINPRRSFERYRQTVRDCSEPWTEAERAFASGLRPVIAETLYYRTNQQVVLLNTELARSNEELDSFAHSASHDLSQPLRNICVYAQLMARKGGADLSEELYGYIDKIESSAERMATLIDALLSYSQVGGSERRKREPVNLENVLSQVLTSLDQQLRESQGTVKHDPLPIVVGDSGTLAQLLQNLISNALKYCGPDGPPLIYISSNEEQGSALISVKDNGEGFDAQYSEEIFTAFKRLHGQDVPGHGIGLYICKRIVALHNGRIWAESEGRNRGATFRFTLPLVDQR